METAGVTQSLGGLSFPSPPIIPALGRPALLDKFQGPQQRPGDAGASAGLAPGFGKGTQNGGGISSHRFLFGHRNEPRYSPAFAADSRMASR